MNDNELKLAIASTRQELAAAVMANQHTRAERLNRRLYELEHDAKRRPSLAHEWEGSCYES